MALATVTTSGTPEYLRLLKSELARRCDRNARYSLRAFAKALGTDPTALSRILAGKQLPSAKMAERAFQALHLSPPDQRAFLVSVLNEKQARGFLRLSPVLKQLGEKVANQIPDAVPASTLDIDLFRVIGDWYHAAILELTFVPGFKPEPRWIAAELGISPTEARLALERLKKLELLEIRGRRMVKTTNRIVTRDRHLSTPALRKLQRQFLEKAIHSLENDPIEERNISAMTMAIDPKNLPLAKKMIEEFTHAICDTLENGKPTRVYNLGVNLYPIQRRSSTSTRSSS